MKKLLIFSSMMLTCLYGMGQTQPAAKPAPQKFPELEKMTPGMTEVWEPEVRIIQPGATNSEAPSDAIILFNGSDINNEWTGVDGKPSIWTVKDGSLISTKGSGYIKSKRVFNDFQLHIEWKTPSEVQERVRGEAIVASSFRNCMRFRCLTIMITEHIVTDRQEQSINNMLLWLIPAENPVNGRHMT
jgi:hypothetical protein